MISEIKSKKDFIQYFFGKGILIEPDALQGMDEASILFEDLAVFLSDKSNAIKQEDVKQFLVQNQEKYQQQAPTDPDRYPVKIIHNYVDEKKKKKCQRFCSLL